MQDVADAELRDQYTRGYSREEDSAPSRQGGQGFVVKGGPWEQQAPNTASTEEFPSFGDVGAPPTAPSPWGPRR